MADTKPIEAMPDLSWQPYDATKGGSSPGASEQEHVYDGNQGADGTGWEKLSDGGAMDMSGKVSGGWPGNGSSDGSAWTQT